MKKAIFFFLSFTLSLLFAVVIGEFVLRVKGDTYSWSEINGRGYLSPYRSGSDDCLHVRSSGMGKYQSPDFGYNLNVNDIGVRDTFHSLEKPDSVLRIIGIGDSFTEGMGAPFDSTWLNQLAGFVSANNEKYIEPIGGGVAGADLISGHYLFSEKLRKYDPDYVIVVVNQTDVNDFFVKGGAERYTRKNCSSNEPPSFELLFEHSHLFRSLLINILGYNWQLLSKNDRNQLWEQFILEYTSTIESYLKFAEEDKFELIVVLHPLVHELFLGHYEYNFEKIKSIHSSDVNYVDVMKPLLIETNHGKDFTKFYWLNDQHFNSEGYRLFAKEVFSRSTLSK